MSLIDAGSVLGRSMLAEDGAADDIEIRWPDGELARLPVSRWLGEATEAELELLDRARGPVLDVGCGPGRHVGELQRRGVVALGIDVLPEAIARTRARGASALRQSVFGRIPRAGSYATALLLDGNVGIGGDPVGLLDRVRTLLRDDDGVALVEIEPAGVGLAAQTVELRTASGHYANVRWGRVGVDGLEELCRATGFTAADVWERDERWFAELAVSAPRRA